MRRVGWLLGLVVLCGCGDAGSGVGAATGDPTEDSPDEQVESVFLPVCESVPEVPLTQLATQARQVLQGPCGHVAFEVDGVFQVTAPDLGSPRPLGADVTRAIFSPRGRQLAFLEDFQAPTFTLHDLESASEEEVPLGEQGADQRRSFLFAPSSASPDGEWLVLCDAQGIGVWDGGQRRVIDDSPPSCRSLVAARAPVVAWFDGERRAKVANLDSGRVQTLATVPDSGEDFFPGFGVRLAPDGQMVVYTLQIEFNCAETCDGRGQVEVFRVSDGARVHREEYQGFSLFPEVSMVDGGRGVLINWEGARRLSVVDADFKVHQREDRVGVHLFADARHLVATNGPALELIDLQGEASSLSDLADIDEVVAVDDGGVTRAALIDRAGSLVTWRDGAVTTLGSFEPRTHHVAHMWPAGNLLVYESLETPHRASPQRASFLALDAQGELVGEPQEVVWRQIVPREADALILYLNDGFEEALGLLDPGTGEFRRVVGGVRPFSLERGPAGRILVMADDDGDMVEELWVGRP